MQLCFASCFLDRADMLKAKKETDGHSTEEEEDEEAQQVQTTQCMRFLECRLRIALENKDKKKVPHSAS